MSDYNLFYNINRPVVVPERDVNPPEPSYENDPYEDDSAYDDFIQE